MSEERKDEGTHWAPYTSSWSAAPIGRVEPIAAMGAPPVAPHAPPGPAPVHDPAPQAHSPRPQPPAPSASTGWGAQGSPYGTSQPSYGAQMPSYGVAPEASTGPTPSDAPAPPAAPANVLATRSSAIGWLGVPLFGLALWLGGRSALAITMGREGLSSSVLPTLVFGVALAVAVTFLARSKGAAALVGFGMLALGTLALVSPADFFRWFPEALDDQMRSLSTSLGWLGASGVLLAVGFVVLSTMGAIRTSGGSGLGPVLTLAAAGFLAYVGGESATRVMMYFDMRSGLPIVLGAVVAVWIFAATARKNPIGLAFVGLLLIGAELFVLTRAAFDLPREITMHLMGRQLLVALGGALLGSALGYLWHRAANRPAGQGGPFGAGNPFPAVPGGAVPGGPTDGPVPGMFDTRR